MSSWTLFSNHGHVLVCLARDSEARLRDVAADVGITERAVQKIVRDLQDGGMISVTKNGRRNSYRIHKKQTLRHQLEAGCQLRDLLKVVNRDPGNKVSAESPAQKPKPVETSKSEKRPKAAKTERFETKPAETAPVELKPAEIKPGKQDSAGQAETVEPKPADSIEKQQRLLF